MNDLIQELEAPRSVPPSALQLRAARVIKKISEMGKADYQARIAAEQNLATAHGEIDRLTQELARIREELENAKATISSASTNTDAG